MSRYLIALDTATEQLVIGVTEAREREGAVVLDQVATADALAPRRANAELLARLSATLGECGVALADVSAVVVGRGPGSFTGVRIGVATAKGLAHGLGVPLYGVGSLDAIAHRAAASGLTGLLGVVGDAMRGEVYPALFRVSGGRVERLMPDVVAAPADVASEWAEMLSEPITLLGNGLAKHLEAFESRLRGSATVADESLWPPSSSGLFAAFAENLRVGDVGVGDPALVLPVYTRLSDAEENERTRREAASLPKNGVGGISTGESPRIEIRPMRRADIEDVVAIEQRVFSDAWSRGVFEDELGADLRAWVVAESGGGVVGYAGIALLVDEAHVMNIAVSPESQGEGIGRALLDELGRRAKAMGARSVTLEVRSGNTAAIGLYESSGLAALGRRPSYYQDTGEDALIMSADLPSDVAAVPESDGRRRVLRGEEDDTLILAIETSCDETAASVMRNGRELLADVVSSQIDFHARFGGVVPEIASRKHTEAVVGVVEQAMEAAGTALGLDGSLRFSDLDALAVTHGPGLVGALVVGLAYAKGVSMSTGVPLVGVNHLEGHLFANVLADADVRPPMVALIVSGGHTSLVHMPEWGVYRTLGETLDDAAGEAFDKVAKVLGLGYPGGPILSRLAAEGDPAAIAFPRAMMHSGDYRFSLSGLKTAVINHIRHEQAAGRDINVSDLAASFQAAVIDVQVAKARRAVEETGAGVFCLGGGVAANPALRAALVEAIEPLGVKVSVPPLQFCTDNAAMIAAAAHHRFLRGARLTLEAEAIPGLRLDS